MSSRSGVSTRTLRVCYRWTEYIDERLRVWYGAGWHKLPRTIVAIQHIEPRISYCLYPVATTEEMSCIAQYLVYVPFTPRTVLRPLSSPLLLPRPVSPQRAVDMLRP